jgi:Zn-dependent peptidase ImmA (M78 family)
MKASILAKINPKALIWAREVCGMPINIAAKKISVSIGRLESFEKGEIYPTISQIRKIGGVYRKPTAFFYFEKLPDKPTSISDFRLLPDSQSKKSPDLLDAIVQARQRRIDAIELYKLLNMEIENKLSNTSMNISINEQSNHIREILDISVEQQSKWGDQYKALNNWSSAISSLGVLVSQFSNVKVSEARGFSLGEIPLPLIAINGKDSPHGRIFTLFHELTHLVIGISGLCDLYDNNGSDINHKIEVYCNEVAANVLVPSNDLLNHVITISNKSYEWEDWKILELSKYYSVSREVILRRLLENGKTSIEFYRIKRKEYSKPPEKEKEGGGFLPPYKRILRDNGSKFTALSISAYHNEKISSLDLSRILGGIKLKHIPSIEEALFKVI